MGILNVHKKIEQERIKKEVMKEVEKKLMSKIFALTSLIWALSLRKEGFGKERITRVLNYADELFTEVSNGNTNFEKLNDKLSKEVKISFAYKDDKIEVKK